jgi:hypothetical protein
MADQILFNAINVNAMETNATIQIGECSATGWDSHNKNQTISGFSFVAFGSFFSTSQNLNHLFDNDVYDTPINDQDTEIIDKSNVG